MAEIYLHTRLDNNEIFYVGIELDSKTKYKKRPYCKNRSLFWKNITNKTNYKVDIIYSDLTNESVKEFEKFLILLYGRKDLNQGTLVNLTNGGDGCLGKVTSNKVKLKIAKAMKGKNKGSENPMFGKKLSKEHKKKLIKYGSNNWMYDNPMNQGKNNPNAKKVINKKTLKIYDCLKECAEELKINKGTLASQLNGHRKNKTDLLYCENYLLTNKN